MPPVEHGRARPQGNGANVEKANKLKACNFWSNTLHITRLFHLEHILWQRTLNCVPLCQQDGCHTQKRGTEPLHAASLSAPPKSHLHGSGKAKRHVRPMSDSECKKLISSNQNLIEAPSGISQVTVVKAALVSEAPPVQAALWLSPNSDTFFLQTEQGVYSTSAPRSSTTVYYKACTKHFPVLLCITKSLHKALPSTTLYYKACTTKLAQTRPSTTVYYKACTTKLAQTRPSTTVYFKACTNTFRYYFVLQNVCTKHFPVLLCTLQEALPSTTLYYKACTKHFPVILCTAKCKACTNTFQYYYIFQSLHKVVPSTTMYNKACTKSFQVLLYTTKLAQTRFSITVYYKACTESFPVLLCTTKLAQTRSSTTVYYKACTNMSQYYCVLQSSHKHVPVLLCTTKLAQKHVPVLPCTTKLAQSRSGTTAYYKACTRHFPVLLCITKLAQTRSSTTIYYKACTKSFPVLSCTTKLAQSRSSTTVYYKACTNTFQYYYILQSLHKVVPSTTMYYKACTITFQYYCVLHSLQKHTPVRGVATFPIDTATLEDKQRRRFCSFPHRHGDASGEVETEVLQLPP